MQQYIDEYSVYSEARMMWNDFRKAYICVEGETDKLFLSTYIQEYSMIQFRALNGWELVYKTLQLAISESFPFLFGIIDRDYHCLLNDGIEEAPQLAFTDQNDIEIMLFCSASFDKFIKVYGSEEKVKKAGDPKQIILSSASYIGALRAVSLQQHYNLIFDGYSCSDFIDKKNLSVDLKLLVKKIIERTRSKGHHLNIENDEIEKEVKDFICNNSALQLSNGHDVLEITCLSMQKLLGTCSATEHNSESVFLTLLMGYTKEEFKSTSLYMQIDKWLNFLTLA